MEDASALSRAKREAGELRLPVSVRQRVADVEAAKRGQQEGDESQAKFVRFDPDIEIEERTPKQPRTELYSPVYAGSLEGSPATSSTTRHVRRVVEEIELHDEDELEHDVGDECLDWKPCETQFDDGVAKVEIFQEDQKRRGFFDEAELAWLDQKAMQAELDRLRQLEVIDDVSDDVSVDECMKLDTRLVRD
jgi:hypothetical protein